MKLISKFAALLVVATLSSVHSLSVQAATMTIKTTDGGTIQTKDFLHNGVTIPDYQNRGPWILAGGFGPHCNFGPGLRCDAYLSKLFTISYYEEGNPMPSTQRGIPYFGISLIEKPLGKARHEAEQFLLKTLGVTSDQLCRVNYMVITYRQLDPRTFPHSQENLGFSFCPGATPL